MQKRTTDKRYYKVDEMVWVKSESTLGVIKELNIKPDENIYEAIVEIKTEEQCTSTLKVNLWEIDKNKKAQFKGKPKAVATTAKKPTILFAKVADDAIIPSKLEENAGYDIYANFEQEFITFAPHETKLVPTGIASSVTKEYALIAKERGSTGSKGMGLRAGVVDSGYRGEIFIGLTNENDKTLVIAKNPELFNAEKSIVYPYTKAIAQLLLVPVIDANVKEIPYEQLKAIPSVRGKGKIGSSGK
ncbi:dUTP diphosphatase [Paenibacillus alvei]|uniref:dUTP diphosphatase n=1 Tax=Paenibacillus alvei TaxID=44250 RepID=UPI000288F901|nr:DUTP diphosphatase Dut [Paenibacillus alvei]EJW13930.1 DUTP diphosphatase Dut [Paenibacillus alvei DSM 29]MCY9542994.1 dUTP diphosphatase [Paenibacillus alvei]MCY9707706.1 dUTP diphosphatase [Paenibacillus alvei]MEC0082781.1 dUTP diphosphatase [Paenibacillus alvei]